MSVHQDGAVQSGSLFNFNLFDEAMTSDILREQWLCAFLGKNRRMKRVAFNFDLFVSVEMMKRFTCGIWGFGLFAVVTQGGCRPISSRVARFPRHFHRQTPLMTHREAFTTAQSHGHRSDDEREKRETWFMASRTSVARTGRCITKESSVDLRSQLPTLRPVLFEQQDEDEGCTLWPKCWFMGSARDVSFHREKNLLFAVRRRSGSLKFNIKRAFSPKRQCPDLAGQVETKHYSVEKHISSLFDLNIIWIWKSLGNVF